MKPYYRDDAAGITLYHGSCLDILPQLEPVDAIITDPVWPNATAPLAGSDDPFGLLAAAAAHFPRLARRVVIQLGCDSDPRFLSAIPASLPFFRICWLEYVQPHYKGRLLYTSDVAYAFGEPPPSRPGLRVVSGKTMLRGSPKLPKGHPCPRQLQHVKWLVSRFAAGPVLDPFCGSGTTLQAAFECGYPAVGVEVDERFCELTARRLEEYTLPLALAT